ncbi:MAG: RluA family pseudouridine synthase [Ruminococcaceae bacterium]|nr:RluA family pseudouridine synthase [Oscillospiraceae bacterium]
MERISVICDTDNIRLDKFIKIENLTRSALQKLIDENKVLINGNVQKASYKLKCGDEIEILYDEPKELDVEAEDIPLNIIYEDEHLLVVNKEQNMVVHPAAGNYSGTLVNALLYHCKGKLSGINGVIRPGIVHRIDKDTSGLLVVAKTNKAHLSLAEQIKEKSVKRSYVCIANGVIQNNKGMVDAPIGRHPSERKKMAVTDKNSKNAVTHFEVIERFQNYTFLTCRLETGRTHQIRVHLKYIGHPVLGDPLYGPKKNEFNLTGQILHAKTLGFVHPQTGDYMEFDSEIPDYFNNILNSIKEKNL